MLSLIEHEFFFKTLGPGSIRLSLFSMVCSGISNPLLTFLSHKQVNLRCVPMTTLNSNLPESV